MRPLMTVLFAGLLCAAVKAAEIRVLGLFPDAALVSIDGRQQLLKAGQEGAGGVKLLEADARRAVLLVDGRRREVGLSDHIAGSYSEAEETEVRIARNPQREYQTNASINGRSMLVVVDTGANFVALSAAHARSLGLKYRDGRPVQVNTASGVAQGYQTSLASVEVGGIEVRSVPAVVIEGHYPAKVLLGMTYLEHIDMQEKDNILILRQSY